MPLLSNLSSWTTEPQANGAESNQMEIKKLQIRQQKNRTRWFLLLLGTSLILILCAGPALSQSNDADWSVPVDVTQNSFAATGIFGFPLCDRYENLHLLWSYSTPQGSYLMYQNDLDGYLSVPIDVVAFSSGYLLRTSAAISEVDDVIHVIWQDQWISGNVYYTRVLRSQAGDPRAWEEPILLAEHADNAELAINNNGVIYVLFGQSRGQGLENTLYLLTSADSGNRWSDAIEVFSNRALQPSTISGGLAIDGSDRIHVGVTLRSQEYGDHSEVGYLRSIDNGRTWSPYRQIMVNGTTFQGVATLRPYAFGEDEVHLTWHDPRRMHQWSSDGGATWSQPVEIMALGAAFGGANDLVKDSAGNLHAIVAARSGVYEVQWSGRTWGTYEEIDGRDIDPHGQHMAICQGNHLHAVYDDRLDDEKVWYSRRTVASPHVDRQMEAGPSLVLDSLTATPLPVPTAPPVPAERQVASILDPSESIQETYSPQLPLILPIIITFGFLGGVLVIAAVWKR